MRNGPRPLSAHIGIASSAQIAGEAVYGVPADQRRRQLEKMLLGIQKYQQYSDEIKAPQTYEIWRAGEVSIHAMEGCEHQEQRPSVLLVPSLVNKSCILNLIEGYSFACFLLQNNINVYILDWGSPVDDEGQKHISSLVHDRMLPAVSFLHKITGANLHLFGYCMGGTLLIPSAILSDLSLRSIILLAAPWDFHAGTQKLLSHVRFWAPSALPAMLEKGRLSMDWLQILFASLDPEMTMKKFSKFYEHSGSAEERALFVAVEDWLSSGVDLPSNLGMHFIREWFLENVPARGRWCIGKDRIDPCLINVPVFIVASRNDKLVEYEMAVALANEIRNIKIHDPQCGHISMMAGRSCVQRVWRPVCEWIHKQT